MRSNLKRSHVAVATFAAALLAVAPAAALDSSGSSGAAPADSAAVKLPNVVILCTGGTIAGTGASTTTTVGYDPAKIGCDKLVDGVPELKKVGNVRGEQVYQIASESLLNEHLLKLSKRINELLKQDDVDGIVVTHGTDTIEETSYFLDLTVKSKKPVVIVGAMRPSTAISADGPINLYNAVLIAGSKEAVGKGVLVSLNDQINAGREVTKTNTSTADTFRTPDLGMLGYVQDNKPHFYRTSTRLNTADTEFDVTGLDSLPQVDIVYGYANENSIALDAFVKAGAKGIVHAGPGDGSVGKQMVDPLNAARKAGVIVVRSSRVGSGIIARNGEQPDDKYDWVASDNLNPQKARILLELALTKTSDTKAIQDMFWKY